MINESNSPDPLDRQWKPLDRGKLVLLLWLIFSIALVFGMFVSLYWHDWSVLIVVAVIISTINTVILWDIRMKVKAIYDKLEIEDDTPQSNIATLLRWMRQVNK